MSIVPPSPRLASAFAVFHGPYGQVTHLARQRGVSRKWLYREAAWVQQRLQGTAADREAVPLRRRLRDLEQRLAETQQRLAKAVVLDRDKQAELAAMACGKNSPSWPARVSRKADTAITAGSLPTVKEKSVAVELAPWFYGDNEGPGPFFAKRL